jgi:competence protein ComEA
MKTVWKTVVCLLLGVLLLSGGGFQALAVEKLDINSATVEQLVEINGVGDVLAQRIVDYRQSHKRFKSIDELSLVKGIGEKKLEKLRPFLTLVENN